MLVTDMPLWADCPFRKRVPAAIEIRRGLNEGIDMVTFWHPETELHVDVDASLVRTPQGRGKRLRPILDQLQWAIDYKRAGGNFASAAE